MRHLEEEMAANQIHRGIEADKLISIADDNSKNEIIVNSDIK